MTSQTNEATLEACIESHLRNDGYPKASLATLTGNSPYAVISAGMPESSAKDGGLPNAQVFDLGYLLTRSFTSL